MKKGKLLFTALLAMMLAALVLPGCSPDADTSGDPGKEPYALPAKGSTGSITITNAGTIAGKWIVIGGWNESIDIFGMAGITKDFKTFTGVPVPSTGTVTVPLYKVEGEESVTKVEAFTETATLDIWLYVFDRSSITPEATGDPDGLIFDVSREKTGIRFTSGNAADLAYTSMSPIERGR